MIFKRFFPTFLSSRKSKNKKQLVKMLKETSFCGNHLSMMSNFSVCWLLKLVSLKFEWHFLVGFSRLSHSQP